MFEYFVMIFKSVVSSPSVSLFSDWRLIGFYRALKLFSINKGVSKDSGDLRQNIHKIIHIRNLLRYAKLEAPEAH